MTAYERRLVVYTVRFFGKGLLALLSFGATDSTWSQYQSAFESLGNMWEEWAEGKMDDRGFVEEKLCQQP